MISVFHSNEQEEVELKVFHLQIPKLHGPFSNIAIPFSQLKKSFQSREINKTTGISKLKKYSDEYKKLLKKELF